jgi:anthranilate phosphoribosyltransferase
MKQILAHLFEYKTFSRQEAYTILNNITAGTYNSSQIVAFMTAFSMRSIRVEELLGFREAMYDLAIKVDFEGRPLIDLCGTGGDGKNTFNISTITSFIVAGAGYSVAKHGNYGVSSGCGSSNVMEFLGYSFTNDQQILKKQLDRSNICFLHAPLFHPAMKSVAPLRKELGVKTFFNMLGPLTNPANPSHQLVGVFSLELARLYGYLLQQTNNQYTILHSLDGYDEISLTGPFKTITNQAEQLHTLSQYGIQSIDPSEIHGGETIADAAKLFISILQGQGTEIQQKVVLFNAAMAIQTMHPTHSLEDCMEEARVSLLSGNAYSCFKRLLETN